MGDASVDTGTFGGDDQIAGVTVARSFALDPYLLRFPAPVLSGTVLTPSRAEIYVNGVLTSVVDVAPGTFVFGSLPAVSGLNTTVVVLRDAFGNVTRVTSQDYSSLDLLRAGLTDFAVSAACCAKTPLPRTITTAGMPFSAATRTASPTDFTAGARFEAGPNVVSGGLSTVVAGRLGALGVAYGASDSGGITDSALQVSFAYQTQHFGFSASSTQTGARYANTSLLTSDDRALLAQDVSASFGITRSGGVTFGIGRTIYRDMGPTSFSSASLYQGLGSILSISLTALRSITATSVSDSVIGQVIVRTGPRSTLVLNAGDGTAGLQFSSSSPSTFGTDYSGAINTDGSGLQDLRFVGQPGVLELSLTAPERRLAGGPERDGFRVARRERWTHLFWAPQFPTDMRDSRRRRLGCRRPAHRHRTPERRPRVVTC